MIRIFKIFFVLLPSIVLGQVNLIPNGSFEFFDQCPTGNSCAGQIEFATGWFEPIICTSDFYHQCADPEPCSTPFAGSVDPYDGVGMAALFLRSGTGEESREYISTGFSSALLQDSLYELKVMLRPSGSNGSKVGSFGAFFSSDSTIDYSLDHDLLLLEPQLQRSPQEIMNDHNLWYEWKDTLFAAGGEQFVVLGNFRNDANTPFEQPGWNPGSAYFIDDVRLTPIPLKPNSINELDVDFSVAPNPSSSILDISYKDNLRPSFIRLLTIDGREVLSEGWRQTLDVSPFAEGVYLLQVEFDNGAVGTERVVISR